MKNVKLLVSLALGLMALTNGASMSRSFMRGDQEKTKRPKLNIEGTWTGIYRDWENSIVCMIPEYNQKGTGSVPITEWKITRDVIFMHPDTHFAYELKTENGVTYFDTIPLDKRGKKIEKDRERGILVLKDDLLFVTSGTKKGVTSLSVSGESEQLWIFRRGAMRYIPDVDAAGEFPDEKR